MLLRVTKQYFTDVSAVKAGYVRFGMSTYPPHLPLILVQGAFYENFSGRQNLRMLAAMSGGADRQRIENVLEIVGLRERGRDEVEQICNRVGIIDGGRLLDQGSVEDLIAKNHWINLKVIGLRTPSSCFRGTRAFPLVETAANLSM